MNFLILIEILIHLESSEDWGLELAPHLTICSTTIDIARITINGKNQKSKKLRR